jgi:hypothetical protein
MARLALVVDYHDDAHVMLPHLLRHAMQRVAQAAAHRR